MQKLSNRIDAWSSHQAHIDIWPAPVICTTDQSSQAQIPIPKTLHFTDIRLTTKILDSDAITPKLQTCPEIQPSQAHDAWTPPMNSHLEP